MSALGHTMASMPNSSGGKPGPSRDDGSDNRGGNGAQGGGKGGARALQGNGRAGGRRSASSKGSVQTGKGTSLGQSQNLNHLLAFTLPPRVAPPSSHLPARRQRRTGASFVPFNKERYVNAQYRFLVKPTGDYTAYFADSDIYLNWSDILTVLIPTSSALTTAHGASTSALAASSSQPHIEAREDAACPICLSPPTAPRMTKCGHVFCYPCILHYLTVHDAPAGSGSSTPTPGYHLVPGAARPAANNLNTSSTPTSAPKWKRCPVCWDAVYARDLKTVQWWDPKARAQEFEATETRPESSTARSDVLCMRLIERPHLTTLALPKSSTWPLASTSTSEQPLIAQHSAPWHFQPDVMTFCKFMLATPDQLLANLDSNIQELEEERTLLSSFMTKDEMGLLFVEMAERKVHEQMEKVANELDTQAVRSRIKYAQRELVEHEEVERGNRERHEEAMSRRQRKREQRQHAVNEGDSAGPRQAKGHSADEDANYDQDRAGTEEFLAVQSQRQGGHANDASNDSAEKEDADTRGTRNSSVRTRKNLNPPAPSASSFFFYQASSGQNIFLHPLDIKILLSAFGAYSAFPKTLHAIIQGADEGSMNDDMRKRCKYLTHLTHSADIVFVEVNWEKMCKESEARDEEPIVGKSILRMYEQPLAQRRNRRRDRERKEDRAKTRFEEQERAKRPPMTTSAGSGRGVFAGASRSPNLGPSDSVAGSLSSQQSLSPGMQEALALSVEEAHQVEDFPAAIAAANGSRPDAAQDVHVGSPSGESTGSATSNGVQHRTILNGATPIRMERTVWGTPAARNNGFADALHNSSRARVHHEDTDVMADFDAWFELEEDFILGARNDRTVREGRGLNRQIKGGQNGQVASRPQPSRTASSGKSAQSPPKPAIGAYQPQWRPSSLPSKEASAALQETDASSQTPAGTAATPGKAGKQQRKKKFVLTSGGRGSA